MRPTRRSRLVAVAVLAAALGWGGVTVADAMGTSLPRVPLLASATLALLGIALLFTGVSMRARLRGREGTRPVNPFVAARTAALAKAASLGGALVAGLYAGVAVFFFVEFDTTFDRQRAWRAGLAALAAVGVVLVAQFLEHVCRIKEPPEDEDERKNRGGGTHASGA